MTPEFNVGQKVMILDGLYQDSVGIIKEIVILPKIVLYMVGVEGSNHPLRVLTFSNKNLRTLNKKEVTNENRIA